MKNSSPVIIIRRNATRGGDKWPEAYVRSGMRKTNKIEQEVTSLVRRKTTNIVEDE